MSTAVAATGYTISPWTHYCSHYLDSVSDFGQIVLVRSPVVRLARRMLAVAEGHNLNSVIGIFVNFFHLRK